MDKLFGAYYPYYNDVIKFSIFLPPPSRHHSSSFETPPELRFLFKIGIHFNQKSCYLWRFTLTRALHARRARPPEVTAAPEAQGHQRWRSVRKHLVRWMWRYRMHNKLYLATSQTEAIVQQGIGLLIQIKFSGVSHDPQSETGLIDWALD